VKPSDVIYVKPNIVPAYRYDGSPDGARLEIEVSIGWVDAGMHRLLRIGQTSYRIPPFVSGVVEISWPYEQGSTMTVPGSQGGNPPPTDSSSSSSEEL
jgi:hypothetical protein